MHPILVSLPLWILAALFGGVAGTALAGAAKRVILSVAAALTGAALAGFITYQLPLGARTLAIHSYGVMVLAGFLTALWMAARRSRLIGVEPRHVVDVGVLGVI